MSNKRLLKLAANPEVAKQDEEDLESLLGDEDVEEEEEEAAPFEEEFADMRKSQAETSRILLSLTRSVSALFKHVMAKEEEEEILPEATTSTPDSPEDVMVKQESATESEFSPYGSSDLGEPDVPEETETDPALEGAAKENADTDPGLVSLAKKGGKSKVEKDDASSNFGEKDSDLPGNPAVTPDTKDWPADQTVIPHSDLAPTLQKLLKRVNAMQKVMVAKGLIKKAQPRGIGVRTDDAQPDLPELEEQARGMTFQELNRMRSQCGDLPRGIV